MTLTVGELRERISGVRNDVKVLVMNDSHIRGHAGYALETAEHAVFFSATFSAEGGCAAYSGVDGEPVLFIGDASEFGA